MMPNEVKTSWKELNELIHEAKGTLTVLVSTRRAIVKDINTIQKRLVKQLDDLNEIVLTQVNDEK